MFWALRLMPQAACQLRDRCGNPLQVFGIVIIPGGGRGSWFRPRPDAAQPLGYDRREQRKEQAAARLADDTSWRRSPGPCRAAIEGRGVIAVGVRRSRDCRLRRLLGLGEARRLASLLTIGIVTANRSGSSRARSILRAIWRISRSKIERKSEQFYWRQIFQQHIATGKTILRHQAAANVRNWRSMAGERQSRSPIAPSRKMPDRSSPKATGSAATCQGLAALLSASSRIGRSGAG